MDIVKIQINGVDAGNICGGHYANCTTAGSTAAKEVTIPNFILGDNVAVSILFTNGFTASSPTLNISNGTTSTGAKPIKLFGQAIPIGKVRNNTILTMVYDALNNQWNVNSIESMVALPAGDAVDLGLPSGLLWCDKNVGADTPEAPGLYFSWGNVEGHAEGSGYDFSQTVYDATAGAALTGNIAVGDSYDMARKNMGAPWRLPTSAEFKELYDNCTVEWISQNGMNGRRFTSNKNGNSIFFAAAGLYDGTTLLIRGSHGHYWSSTYGSASYAYYLGFGSSDVFPQDYSGRRYGFSVRAVQ